MQSGKGRKRNISTNVFNDESSDEDDDGAELTGRDQTARQIAAEQAALRKRAEAAAAAVQDPSIYDYDGVYDSFKKDDKKEENEQNDRKSRYIGELLKAAKNREQERDSVFERKMAREQAKEEEELGLEGKEKFLTKAYKRKLEERQRWEADEEERQKMEEANDVTKKSSDDAFTSFYGNLSSNIALGGGEEKSESVDPKKGTKEKTKLSCLDPTEKSDSKSEVELTAAADEYTENVGDDKESEGQKTAPIESGLSFRATRERKVAEARVRYLQRKAGAVQSLE